MALVDEVTIHVASGKGGDGVVRWLRTKENARGGPSGGDGGRGGDVILVGVRDLSALSHYRFEKHFHAQNGEAGRGELQRGADGANLEMPVPIGTVARIEKNSREHEITKEGERLVLFKGGAGGLGNARFKSSTNQNPFDYTPGKAGEGSTVTLSLKLIADAGLIGLPNSGKSSLLNALTRAKAKTGDYAFTTLEPNLGDFYGHILADIPGLIEGASSGRGLGTKFLKHIERTRVLLHLVSADQDDPLDAYTKVRNELEAFGHGLTEKLEIIVLSKIDLVPRGIVETRKGTLHEQTGREVLLASIHDTRVLKESSDSLTRILSKTESGH